MLDEHPRSNKTAQVASVSDSSPVCCLGLQWPITEDRLVLRRWFLITSTSQTLHPRPQVDLKLLYCALALVAVAWEAAGLISFDRAVGCVVQV